MSVRISDSIIQAIDMETQNIVLNAIEQLIEEKKKKKEIPHCAMLVDVANMCNLPAQELREELIKLKSEGKIAFKQTINSWSIYLT